MAHLRVEPSGRRARSRRRGTPVQLFTRTRCEEEITMRRLTFVPVIAMMLGLLEVPMSTVAAASPAVDTSIRPFKKLHVPQSALDDLRRRINATQWPEKETVADSSQGVPLAMMREVA